MSFDLILLYIIIFNDPELKNVNELKFSNFDATVVINNREIELSGAKGKITKVKYHNGEFVVASIKKGKETTANTPFDIETYKAMFNFDKNEYTTTAGIEYTYTYNNGTLTINRVEK